MRCESRRVRVTQGRVGVLHGPEVRAHPPQPACCMDPEFRRTRPNPIRDQAMRTEIGRRRVARTWSAGVLAPTPSGIRRCAQRSGVGVLHGLGVQAYSPQPRSGSGDAHRDRASQLQHTIERVDGDLHLGRPALVLVRAHPPPTFHVLRTRNLVWGFFCQVVIAISWRNRNRGSSPSSLRGSSVRITSYPVGPRTVRTTIPHAWGQGSEEWDPSWERGLFQPRFRSVTIHPGSGRPTSCIGLRIGSCGFDVCVSPPWLASARRLSEPDPG